MKSKRRKKKEEKKINWPSDVSEDFEINYKDKLGNGAFGIVYSGRSKDTGVKVAVKTINKAKLKRPMDLAREARILKEVSDPRYVCSLLGAYDTEETFILVLEFCGGGDFDRRIRRMLTQHGNPISEVEILPWVAQMFASVAFMHEHHIIHRDIKPANFLIQRKPHTKLEYLKLADFGLAIHLKPGTLMYGGGGTPVYMSPERHKAEGYSFNADVFSCGCILGQLLNRGKHPFYSFEKKVFYKTKLLKGDIEEFDQNKVKKFSLNLKREMPKRSKKAILLLKQTLTSLPKLRLSAEKCLYHKWFDSVRPVSCFSSFL